MHNKYTDCERKFIIEHNYGKTRYELSELFNKHFNCDKMTPNKIKAFRANNKLRPCGLTGKFNQGHIPHNKGRHISEYLTNEQIQKIAKTQFHKGQKIWNTRNIYDERINKDGYIEIKVDEKSAWELKHRYIYKKKHGEIPNGYNVIFLDGDKTNLSIENLMLIDQRENAYLNKNGLRYSNKDCTMCGIMLAKINKQIKECRNYER